MARTRDGGKGVGGYPTGLRGAPSEACTETPCLARVGRRCSTYTKDREGRPVWVRYQAKPHKSRVLAARLKGHTP